MRKTFTIKIQKTLFDNQILNTIHSTQVFFLKKKKNIHKRENRVMFKAHDDLLFLLNINKQKTK